MSKRVICYLPLTARPLSVWHVPRAVLDTGRRGVSGQAALPSGPVRNSVEVDNEELNGDQ